MKYLKIKNIKINGYGNLKEKEINLCNKINIIYGKNESGKSTFFKFIINMLYGASKNKKGRDISDFDKYKPWSTENFSGRMEYTLDNEDSYSIYREFKKKVPIIYNRNGEDISENYNIDKNTGNQFFYEQTKIDEELFLSSTAVMQQEVEMDTQSKNAVIQKLSNLAGSGNYNISYKKCIDTLNKRQLTEIGTERSQDRPINKINNKLEELNLNKKELLIYQDKKYEIEKDIDEIQRKIEEQENKVKILNELVVVKQKLDIEEEKIKINTEINQSNKLEIDEIQKEKEIKEKELAEIRNSNNNIKTNKKIYLTLLLIFIAITLVSIIVIKSNLKFLSLIPIVILAISYILNVNNLKNKNRKINKEKLENKKSEINKINSQLEILVKNKDNIDKEIEVLTQEIKGYMSNKNEIASSVQNLEKEKNILNEYKLQLHMIEVDKNNIYPKLDKLANIEEKIEEYKEEKVLLENKNKSIESAKEVLQDAYKIMKENITPKFSENLSNVIANISNNKYNKVRITDDNNIIVEIENGKYIPIDLLSTGTIDQLYLALRMSIIKEIVGESIPLILDESFAYYDDIRLENMLKYIANNIDNQVIILTCTNREKEILNKINIDYNYIKLSNDL